MLSYYKNTFNYLIIALITLLPISCVEEPDNTPEPEADFEASATSVLAGTSVEFSDLSEGPPETWSWSFNGGTPTTSNEQSPEVVYETPGLYNVSLTVSNSAGEDTETKSEYIQVFAELTADFEADKEDIAEGETVTFTNLTSGATSWSWTFEGGDPATSTDENPTVTFAEVGVYEVSLEVSNDLSSDTETKADYIQVFPKLEATFEADKVEIAEGESVTFTDMTAGATAWTWTFEGGTPATSTDQNPTVTYTETGVYEVSLVASSDVSTDTETKTGYITVVDPYPTLATEAAVIESLEEAGEDLFDFLRFSLTFDGVLTNQVTLSNPAWQSISSHNFISTNAQIFKFWDTAYKLLYKVNNVIVSAPEVVENSSLEQSLVAQAKVVRAIIYLELVDYFGNVPIETTQKPSGADLIQSQTSDVIDLVIADLSESESILPSTGNNELGFTRDLARGFLIRAHLRNQSWNDALNVSSQIINEGNYSLDANLSDIYTETSAESFLSFEKNSTDFSIKFDFDTYFTLGNYVPLFRLTEVYLAQAEASFNLGDSPTAQNSLNLIRPRRSQATLTGISSGDILNQWETELDHEGLWFGTLKRYDKASEELMIDPFKVILPIPQAYIDQHPNLVQNPGY